MLDKAIDILGGQSELAGKLGLTPMAVTQWKDRGVPPKRAIDIEKLTEGKVTRFDLLPEFFGDPPQVKVA